MRAGDAVRKNAVTVGPDTPLPTVAQRMDQDAVGAVVVVDGGGAPLGIVTDRDLVVRGLARGNVDGRVDSVMSTDVVVAEADGDLREVVRLLAGHPVRRVVLERDGVVTGVMSVDDLLIDLVADLSDLVRPVTAEVLFGHAEAGVPATTAGSR